MNPATIIQLLMAVLGSQTGRDIMRRGMTGESIAKVFTAMRGTPGVAVKAIKPDAVKSFIGGLSANPITATASEGGMGILAKAAGLIKAHPIATAALAIPAIGMMIGRGEDDRRAEQSAMLQQQQMGEGGGMGKDLKNAMMLMQLAKLMQKAQDNSAEMTLPTGMRPADDATLLM